MNGLAVMTSEKLGKSGCLCQRTERGHSMDILWTSVVHVLYKVPTYFATLILRKVKEIETNPTTRFEDIELNCVVG